MGRDEWSFAVGVRRVLMQGVLRGVLFAVAWAGLIWMCADLIAEITPRVYILPALGAGAVIGWAMAHNVEKHPGFTGLGLASIMFAMALAAILGGVFAANAYASNDIVHRYWLSGLAATGALASIIVVIVREA